MEEGSTIDSVHVNWVEKTSKWTTGFTNNGHKVFINEVQVYVGHMSAPVHGMGSVEN